jgi:hypothetical protein
LILRRHFNNLRAGFYDDLTAAVVALPLALAFGVASDTGLVALRQAPAPIAAKGDPAEHVDG